MDISKTCLLITGCITPNSDVPLLALKDMDNRRKQYLESIIFFLTKSNLSKIVFCDNSNSPKDDKIYEIAKKKGKDFEWLSFMGNSEEVINKGKGYGEGEIIKYAISNSSIIKNCETIIKVTGRLIVKNLNTCLFYFSNKYSYFDFHKDFVETKCYFIRKDVYEAKLLSVQYEVDDKNGYYLEHAMYDNLRKDRSIRQIPIYLNIIGQSGSTGELMDEPSLGIKILKTIKRLLIKIKRAISI